MGFPQTRLRRWRRTPALRDLVRETIVGPADLIEPMFVAESPHLVGEIDSMPGVQRVGLDQLEAIAHSVAQCGIRGVLLFGLPAEKDAAGSAAYATDGIVPRAIARLKSARPDLVVMADVCLCEYTDHGHCGILEDGRLHNDRTLESLARAGAAYAAAGADIVAPSAMMDGMIASIRSHLDELSFQDVAILSYAAKYASCFYGPFRDAAQCASFGDRRTHQMDPANRREALAEVRLDVQEGADAVMVKPAMPYLDVLHAVRQGFPDIPLAAYQVSGEYAMIKAAAQRGWIDEHRAVLEALTSIKRSGADMIITYFARQLAEALSHDG